MAGFIIGTGRHLPAEVVTNTQLSGPLGVSPEWIATNTGIRTRHWADAAQATSDLAVVAAQRAVEAAGLQPEEIDYLIAGTMTPDHQIPGIAPLVQIKLGLRQIPCLDIRTTCCNPLYGFDLASALLGSHRAQHVLLVGAEVQSKGLQLAPEAKEISVLFGDGAGACVISKVARPGAIQLVDISLLTDGTFARDLAVLAPGTGNGNRWAEEDKRARSLFYPVMNGRTVILHAARKLGEVARMILLHRGWSTQDLDLVIPHQANANLLLALGRQLAIPAEKIVSILEWSGNTSSASMLIALDWAYEREELAAADRILFVGFGAGFTWGAALGIVDDGTGGWQVS
jgi:3-oxoacyl-[acyl-carrier-protein] synthase III